MSTDPLTLFRTRETQTPQTEQSRPDEVMNSAGGFVFGIDRWAQLNRFLITGSGDTYYASAKDVTLANAKVLLDAIQVDPIRVVEMIKTISIEGRAAKQQTGLFALALVGSMANLAGRRAAFDAMPEVARTASTLFTWMKYVKQFRSLSGKLPRRAGQAWFNDRPADRLSYQMVKYRTRDGWSTRDAFRVFHPKPATHEHDALYEWATKGTVSSRLPAQVLGFIDLQGAESPEQAAAIIREHNLPWEAVPDTFINTVPVWEALLDANIGMTALIRQLPRLTNLGLLGKGKGTRVNQVVEQLTDIEALRKGRIHPINALVALKTYAGGRSLKGSTTWTPESKIIDALDESFYGTFKVAEPTGKRILLAVDCSGSMVQQIPGMPLSSREAAGAMALSVAKVEKDYDVVGFTSNNTGYRWDPSTNALTELTISPRQRLNDAMRTLSLQNFGATDCALPFTWALEKGAFYDAVLILTDNETFAGPVHVDEALARYRNKINPQVRLIAAAFNATRYSIADPNDALSLDIAGLDSAVPSLVQNFIRGTV